MIQLKRFFAPKEVRAALGVLDELACTFDNEAFRIVHLQVERWIFSNPQKFAARVRAGTRPRNLVLAAVSDLAARHVESGEYHYYRGFLPPGGLGEDFVKIYDASVDEAVRLGFITDEWAKEQRAGLRRNIETVG